MMSLISLSLIGCNANKCPTIDAICLVIPNPNNLLESAKTRKEQESAVEYTKQYDKLCP